MPNLAYFLGCPEWGNKYWTNNFFAPKSKAQQYLAEYCSVFNTVEGNTTFYGIPRPETVSRWRERSTENFRFCFKFPRKISHEKHLLDAEKETEEFFSALAPLGRKLGPFFLQLPPYFNAGKLDDLEAYLADLPGEYLYAVEVRHPDFFDNGPVEEAFEDLLGELGINRVLMDSRPLHASKARDADTKAAQQRKPKVPVRYSVTAGTPFVRFIGESAIENNTSFLRAWVEQVDRWLEQGLSPYMFLHTPNDHFAPELARAFHTMLLKKRSGVGELRTFPIDRFPAAEDKQLSLFDL